MIKYLLSLTLVFLTACITTMHTEVHLASRENNVCKNLIGNVVVYAIFVDSKYSKPWSEYDIQSTLDSINKGMNWLMAEARKQNHYLNIEIDYHKTAKGVIPIYNDFSKKTLSGTIFKLPLYSGIKDVYKWADKVAAEAGKSFPADSSRIVKTPNNLKDRERLIARLRDIHKTDHIALMYFINNYYSEEISVSLDNKSNSNIEFSIVSFKKPAVIVHEFLHLFGAWDLYITPFDKKRSVQRKKEKAMELFPNEIMAFAYRNLDSLEISQFTRYAIGWDKKLDPQYTKLILGNTIKPAKY